MSPIEASTAVRCVSVDGLWTFGIRLSLSIDPTVPMPDRQPYRVRTSIASILSYLFDTAFSTPFAGRQCRAALRRGTLGAARGAGDAHPSAVKRP